MSTPKQIITKAFREHGWKRLSIKRIPPFHGHPCYLVKVLDRRARRHVDGKMRSPGVTVPSGAHKSGDGPWQIEPLDSAARYGALVVEALLAQVDAR